MRLLYELSFRKDGIEGDQVPSVPVYFGPGPAHTSSRGKVNAGRIRTCPGVRKEDAWYPGGHQAARASPVRAGGGRKDRCYRRPGWMRP